MQGEAHGRHYGGPDQRPPRSFPTIDPRALSPAPPMPVNRPALWPRILRLALCLSGWLAFGLLWLMR
jgi:hypothetical protein